MHKAFNIQYTYDPAESELLAIARLINAVPNTFHRWDDHELNVLHFPVVHGMEREDDEIESSWNSLCQSFGV